MCCLPKDLSACASKKLWFWFPYGTLTLTSFFSVVLLSWRYRNVCRREQTLFLSRSAIGRSSASVSLKSPWTYLTPILCTKYSGRFTRYHVHLIQDQQSIHGDPSFSPTHTPSIVTAYPVCLVPHWRQENVEIFLNGKRFYTF